MARRRVGARAGGARAGEGAGGESRARARAAGRAVGRAGARAGVGPGARVDAGASARAGARAAAGAKRARSSGAAAPSKAAARAARKGAGTTRYDIHTDVAHGPLEVVDLGARADACTQPWWNQSLCRVNDSVARVGVFRGEFHWHKHDREDELFYVVEGRLLLDVDEPGRGRRTVALGPRQAFVVPRGIVHRTRAPSRTVVLMVEAASVIPTGD